MNSTRKVVYGTTALMNAQQFLREVRVVLGSGEETEIFVKDHLKFVIIFAEI